MKVAVISDTHFGVRNDNQALLDNFKRFFDTVFFPYLDKHNIKALVHMGDLVDRRKYTNHQTAHRLRTDFLNPLRDREITLHLLAGNHDTHYKNSNIVNAFELLGLGDNDDNLYTYIHPQEHYICAQVQGDKPFFFLALPWICAENEAASFKAIEESDAKVCFAHLELKGFEMDRKGSFNDKGHEASRFAKFDRVFTGHYHYPSTVDNIHYLGSPFEMTWADYGSIRGFHILDTDTLELTFIENPHKMFHMINYSQKGNRVVGLEDYRNTYVKVVVEDRDDIDSFDRFIQSIEEVAIDVQVIDPHLNSIIKGVEVDQTLSTIDILQKTIDEMDVKEEYRRDLNELLKSLYHEAHVLQS